jgi:hypothetical protein
VCGCSLCGVVGCAERDGRLCMCCGWNGCICGALDGVARLPAEVEDGLDEDGSWRWGKGLWRLAVCGRGKGLWWLSACGRGCCLGGRWVGRSVAG